MGNGRCCGLTTAQIKRAPLGAVFVWLNGDMTYPKNLAHFLGRDDLRIVTLSQVRAGALRGLRLSGLEVDHAARPDERERAELAHVAIHLPPNS